MHLELPKEKVSSKVQTIIKVILGFNILVFLMKLYIGITAQSLSILGDAAHSGVDSLNNVLGLAMVYIASQPPDREHPYGHEKFETLGAIAIVAFLGVASFELIEKSIMRFLHPAELPIIDKTTIIFLLITLVINIFVWLYEKNAGHKYNSEFLKADAEHTFSDILITLSILASTYFILKGYYFLDPLLGILIAFIILRSAFEIAQRTVPILVDEFWIDPEELEKIAMSVNKVAECEDIKSRKSHLDGFIEMTVKFRTDSLVEAHKLSHEIEHKIHEKHGDCLVTIHIEPV